MKQENTFRKIKIKKSVDTSNINWMRKRIKPGIISSCLTNMLIKKAETKEKEDPTFYNFIHRSSFIQRAPIKVTRKSEFPDSLSSQGHFKPEYFFSQMTMDKIYKIRDIFLEFDRDRSRTLELSELYNMFTQNNIPISLQELSNLFMKKSFGNVFSDKLLVSSGDTNIDRLNFYQLVLFAISQESSEGFREMMRNLRTRLKNRQSSDDKIIKKTENKQTEYLPMDFNKALEHFSNKGKIRANLHNIQESLEKIDRFNDNMKKKPMNDPSTISEYKDYKFQMALHKEIDYNQIITNFSNIISISSRNLVPEEKKSPQGITTAGFEDILPNIRLSRNKGEEKVIEQSTSDNLPAIGISSQSYATNCPVNMASVYQFKPLHHHNYSIQLARKNSPIKSNKNISPNGAVSSILTEPSNSKSGKHVRSKSYI